MNIEDLIDHPPRVDAPVDLVGPVLLHIRQHPRHVARPYVIIFSVLALISLLASAFLWLVHVHGASSINRAFSFSWSMASVPSIRPIDVIFGLALSGIVYVLFTRQVSHECR